jgi:hypothetical protein
MKVLHSYSSWNIPTRGEKTLPGWLMFEDEGILIFRNVGSSLSIDMAKLASRLRNINYFSQCLLSLLLINKRVWLFWPPVNRSDKKQLCFHLDSCSKLRSWLCYIFSFPSFYPS